MHLPELAATATIQGRRVFFSMLSGDPFHKIKGREKCGEGEGEQNRTVNWAWPGIRTLAPFVGERLAVEGDALRASRKDKEPIIIFINQAVWPREMKPSNGFAAAFNVCICL